MTDEPFKPRPRITSQGRRETDRANLRAELKRIDMRLHSQVIGTRRTDFIDGSPSYDAASMAIVRLTTVLERQENSFLHGVLTKTEQRSLVAVRNIVAHGGYSQMDDESFWISATRDLPDLIRRLQQALPDTDAEPTFD
ncbi:antitoxin [Paramicrobacterium fandaimingii]|uniref:antitoxin n=1 Tax=Paramicrobacterium fandaimingii TaxID=2708079 RepID=UPI00141E9DA4|nr:antitoxin [Microbacterium fandaimingii]